MASMGDTKFTYGTKHKGKTFQQLAQAVEPEFLKRLSKLVEEGKSKEVDTIRSFLTYFNGLKREPTTAKNSHGSD